MLEEEKSFQNLTKIIDVQWPSDMFTNTKLLNWSPTSINFEGDMAILLDPAKAETNGSLKKLSARHPAVLDMVRKNEGQIDYLASTTATKRRNQEVEEKTTSVYILPLQVNTDGINNIQEAYNVLSILPLQVNTDGINNIQEAYNVLRELKGIYKGHPLGRLNIMLSDGLDQQYMIYKGHPLGRLNIMLSDGLDQQYM
ncbi:hypothetical protein QE152_g7657 [Popillia japonica]|uniref:Uncharacterized protein n=1 Tax=Popillia japonica TaxID=7064 RepID=A0AAW1ME94_POPJA